MESQRSNFVRKEVHEPYNLVQTLGGTQASWASTNDEDVNRAVESNVVSYVQDP
jgi:hypothetical protein